MFDCHLYVFILVCQLLPVGNVRHAKICLVVTILTTRERHIIGVVSHPYLGCSCKVSVCHVETPLSIPGQVSPFGIVAVLAGFSTCTSLFYCL